MNGLAWLNDLMVWLARWVPRLTLIRRTHAGVVFGPGGRVRAVSPRLFCYWPITHELQLVAMWLRTLELAAQLHDGEVVSVVVGWRVVNPVLAATSIADADAQLDDRAQAALARAHRRSRDGGDVCLEICQVLRSEFQAYGIAIESVDIAQRSWVLPIKQLNDYAFRDKGGWG